MVRPRILFASPEDSMISDFFKYIPDHSNVLAMNVLNRKPEDIICEARQSAIEVIISRGGVAEYLRDVQKFDGNKIPIVSIDVTTFDICEAINKAITISKNIAFLAHSVLLDDIHKVTSLFDINTKFVSHSTPSECIRSVFNALESKADVIVCDSRVAKICEENNIPFVLLQSGSRSYINAWNVAQQICNAIDNSKKDIFYLTSIIDNIPGCVLILNREGNIIYASQQSESIIGVSNSSLVNNSISKIEFFRNIDTSFVSERFFEKTLKAHSDKSIFRLRWAMMANEQAYHGLLHIDKISSSPVQLSVPHHKEQPTARFTFDDILGGCERIAMLKQTAMMYANSDANVLICGDSGTGKELFAQAIHTHGPRRSAPFVALNLAAIPPNLVESELFGYVRGAFTDANRNGRPGIFEYAENGTVFLDEIGEISNEIQSRLLRVLQEGEFMRLGDSKMIKCKCRIIAATNINLEQAVKIGRFRKDLFYRLNILRLDLPNLNERKDDIEMLSRFFIKKYNEKYGIKVTRIDENIFALLKAHTWNGNIRELEAVIERVIVTSSAGCISESDISLALNGIDAHFEGGSSESDIQKALERYDGNISMAAKSLGIHRTTLWRKLKGSAVKKG